MWDALAANIPAIAPYAESMSCAVNADYARMTTAVGEGDEVAFLPPVSGGCLALLDPDAHPVLSPRVI